MRWVDGDGSVRDAHTRARCTMGPQYAPSIIVAHPPDARSDGMFRSRKAFSPFWGGRLR